MIRLKTFQRVLHHFNGDIAKAKNWFEIPNPVLEDLKPSDYAKMGKHDYLDKMIDSALEESSHAVR